MRRDERAAFNPQTFRRLMHRRLRSRRVYRTALITLGLVTAVSAGALRTLSNAEARTPARTTTRQPSNGKQIFATTCAACHQPTGQGVEGAFPPLDKSEWVNGDEAKMVRIIMHGLSGPVEVAGQTYSSMMPPWGGVLSDADIAAVATYVRGAWGNKAAPVTTATVASIRAATAKRSTPWTVAELAKVAIPIKKD
jgi:mono/diheme cytochrome c family protein